MGKIIQYTQGISNGFFVIDEGIIAVDCGSELGVDVFQDVCRETGVDPEDIRLIVSTHGHGDHFLNMKNMREMSGAPVLCHILAADAMRKGSYPDVKPRNETGEMLMGLNGSSSKAWPWNEQPIFEPDILVNSDTDLRHWGVRGYLTVTPGHAEGSLSVILEWGDVIAGDLIVEAPGSGMCGLAYFAENLDDSNMLYSSIQKILSLGNVFYCGHGGPFTEKEVNVALAEEMKKTDAEQLKKA